MDTKAWLSGYAQHLRRRRHWFVIMGLLSLLGAAVAWLLGYLLTPP